MLAAVKVVAVAVGQIVLVIAVGLAVSVAMVGLAAFVAVVRLVAPPPMGPTLAWWWGGVTFSGGGLCQRGYPRCTGLRRGRTKRFLRADWAL